MKIKIYNSQSKNKEDFKTISPNVVNMYVCGPTVYDYLHVGNFRGSIFFNMARNFLESQGYTVNYAYNFTDVDDKIINKSIEMNKPALEVSEFFIQEFLKDYSDLKLRPHTINPKVSEYIPQMIKYVEEIISKNMAYVDRGSVYLRRSHLPHVGCLSGRDINQGLTGEKNHTEHKEHEADFALWKGAKDGEISWDSPWGKGRPGWHLECSVMIYDIFQGQTLDIHGGGLDLLFPHHENEVNQCLAHGEHTLANFWMHNNMLNMGNQKMSKSLGNVQTGRSFIKEHSGEVLKFIILSQHYRSIIDFKPENIQLQTNYLARFYQSIKKAHKLKDSNRSSNLFDSVWKKFNESLADDFNTPEAFSHLYEALNQFNKDPKKFSNSLVNLFENVGQLLNLFQEDSNIFLNYLDQKDLVRLKLSQNEIENLINQRNTARQNKDFQASDQIRAELVSKGINLLDYPTGTEWEVIRVLSKPTE